MSFCGIAAKFTVNFTNQVINSTTVFGSSVLKFAMQEDHDVSMKLKQQVDYVLFRHVCYGHELKTDDVVSHHVSNRMKLLYQI
ncbi:MAG: hypothetical protein IPK61_01245 [Saprospiraceae bacterium]|nr:hypothetical protein [Saprospiraceae bacterium]MBK7795995.1 hypothetical protein [Saprospiraceae bacterium]MBK8151818.1 hypothetical protein [Saprospiraceae bacterium]MBK9378168.1 hypothetical protein [Saprospiraceae bacterium]